MMNSLIQRTLIVLLGSAVSGMLQAQSLNGDPSSLFSNPRFYFTGGMDFAKAAQMQVPETAALNEPIPLFDSSRFFLEVYTGYDYSFLGDIVNGTKAWIPYANAVGDTGSASTNNSGILAGALFGLHLDKTSSLALDLGGVFPLGGNNWSVNGMGFQDSQTCDSILLDVSVDYRLNLLQSPGARTYVTAGAGWYHAIVSYTLVSPSAPCGGTFTGDTLGGTLGVGEEISLGPSVGLDVSVRGRYASFSQVSASSATALDGLDSSATGASSLSIYNYDQYPILVPTLNSYASANSSVIRNAMVDFSGIDATAAVAFYF